MPLPSGTTRIIAAAIAMFALLQTTVAAAPPPVFRFDFARLYGDSGSDDSVKIVRDTEGSVFLTYSRAPSNTEPTGPPVASDVVILKLDAAGQTIWERRIGGNGQDVPTNIALDADGNVLVVGWTLSTQFGGQRTAGDADAFILSVSPEGKRRWVRFVGGAGPESSSEASLSPNGQRIYLVGYTASDDLGGAPSLGGSDGFFATFDARGSRLGLRRFGGSDDDYPNALAVTEAGGVYVAGRVDLGGGNSDAFLTRLAPDGSVVFRKDLRGSGYDSAGDLVTADGKLFLVGSTRSVRLAGQLSHGGSDAMVASYSTAGKRRWVRLIGGIEDDLGQAISVLEGRTIYITGDTRSSWRRPALMSDVLVARLRDADAGLRQRVAVLQGPGTDGGQSIVAGPADLYLAGFTGGPRFKGQRVAGPGDVFLVKLH